MPVTEYQGLSATLTNAGRSILSLRRDHQVHSMDGSHIATSLELDLESYQKHVTDWFVDLSSASHHDLLSLSWIQKLLDAFLVCQEQFKIILFAHKSQISKPPMDRIISEYLDRSIKTLDVCNAIRDGIEQLRQWKNHLEIVLTALYNTKAHRPLCEGQFRRAKKTLTDLAISMLDDKDSGSSRISQRNRSFGRNNAARDQGSFGHFRSLSWSVSRSWSAARQLQAIGNNLAAPRGNEILASNGLAVPVYTMNMILLFVMWVLVAAIPCQDRGLQVHFSVPRQFSWGGPMILVHDRILEESRSSRERRNACGLLKEFNMIEKCVREINELADSAQFPLTEEKEVEVKERVIELSRVCDAMKACLDPLERQVREVFHRIVRSRTEGLDSLGRAE